MAKNSKKLCLEMCSKKSLKKAMKKKLSEAGIELDTSPRKFKTGHQEPGTEHLPSKEMSPANVASKGEKMAAAGVNLPKAAAKKGLLQRVKGALGMKSENVALRESIREIRKLVEAWEPKSSS